ncbi:MAG: inositol monophosphatase [Planctomycetaceae bacterium]|nr:MAG: inositol monophosphatase [Planctomycetaceae bacterium]
MPTPPNDPHRAAAEELPADQELADSHTPNSIDRLLEVAREAALAGGEVLMRHLRDGVQMRNKTASGGVAHDLVSDADLESERTVADLLTGAFPDHSLLGEESLGKSLDPNDCEHLWVIDPLDGTTNFAHAIPHFAVSIAYYHRGVPQVGVVFNPARDDWFTAAVGRGAHHNGRQARVDGATGLAQSLVGCGFYYDRGEMMRCTLRAIEDCFGQQIHGIRRFGTAALDLCMVGCGHYGGFFEYHLSPWDFAAGRLFVELAGGQVTTTRGEPLGLVPSGVLATNGHLHEPLLAITRRHHPSPIA